MVYEPFTISLNRLARRLADAYQSPDQLEELNMAGLHLEEFQQGYVFRHALTKTVTESDNMLFSVMTLNPQPLHIDFDFAAKSEWGKPLVNSLFTLGLMIGISVHDTTIGTTIGNLGMTETVFPHPVFHGDTIRVETEVMSVRESRSKSDRGIVEFEHRAFNQLGVLVARCRRQAMIKKLSVGG
jgi:acyl dehydratase